MPAGHRNIFFILCVWERLGVAEGVCGIHAWWLTVAAVVILVIYTFNSASLSSDCVLVCLTRGNLVRWCYCLTHVFFFLPLKRSPFPFIPSDFAIAHFHLFSFFLFISFLCVSFLSFLMPHLLFHIFLMLFYFHFLFLTPSSHYISPLKCLLLHLSITLPSCIVHPLFSTGCKPKIMVLILKKKKKTIC